MSAPIGKPTTQAASTELRASPHGERRAGRASSFRSALAKRTDVLVTRAARPPTLGERSGPTRPVELEHREPVRREKPEVESAADDAGAWDIAEASFDGRPLLEMDLAPFRVNPALQPIRSAAPDPVPQDQAASRLASELVESMRVGRFGRDGHAVSMRVRTPSGVIGVELREDDGSLRMALDGASAAELDMLGDRVRRALRERGIELEVS